MSEAIQRTQTELFLIANAAIAAHESGALRQAKSDMWATMDRIAQSPYPEVLTGSARSYSPSDLPTPVLQKLDVMRDKIAAIQRIIDAIGGKE